MYFMIIRHFEILCWFRYDRETIPNHLITLKLKSKLIIRVACRNAYHI